MRLLFILLASALIVSMISFGFSALAADVKVLYFVDAAIAARLQPLRPVLKLTSVSGKTVEY